MPGPASGTSALLIVDMINLFDFDGGPALAAAAEPASRAIERLRRKFHAAGAPVIFANDNFTHWRSDFHELVATCTHPAAPGAAIATRLAPGREDYFVLKPKHSAFMSTPLPFLLESLGVRRIVLTGIAADACVLATAIDGNAQGHAMEVVRDGVASRTPALAADALSVLRRSRAAKIVTSARTRP